MNRLPVGIMELESILGLGVPSYIPEVVQRLGKQLMDSLLTSSVRRLEEQSQGGMSKQESTVDGMVSKWHGHPLSQSEKWFFERCIRINIPILISTNSLVRVHRFRLG
jgi:hypothetical protein